MYANECCTPLLVPSPITLGRFLKLSVAKGVASRWRQSCDSDTQNRPRTQRPAALKASGRRAREQSLVIFSHLSGEWANGVACTVNLSRTPLHNHASQIITRSHSQRGECLMHAVEHKNPLGGFSILKMYHRPNKLRATGLIVCTHWCNRPSDEKRWALLEITGADLKIAIPPGLRRVVKCVSLWNRHTRLIHSNFNVVHDLEAPWKFCNAQS